MRAVVFVVALVACGDNAVTPDALPPDAIDAGIDGPPPPPGCDWGELADLTNHTTPEMTGLVHADELVMCGAIDVGHAATVIDSDVFDFAITGERALRVELVGAGLDGLERVELALVNRFGDAITSSRFVGTHAVVAATLPAGTYGVAVRAIGTEPAAAIAYTATIAIDTSSCMAATSAYTEAADGAGTGNDMIDVRFTSEPRRMLTAAADAPEPTGITLAGQARVTGTSANVDAADEFRDRDTFAFTTGTVDTLTVRLDWTSTTVDLDFFVFTANTLPELAGATRVSTSGSEIATLAVAPNTTYWLWIGSYDSSTGLPITYDATLCAE